MGATAVIAAGAGASAFAQYRAGKANAAVSEYNARLGEMQAVDAEQRGMQEAELYGLKIRRLLGEQTANYAGQGVDVGVGAPTVIAEETQQWGRAEQLRTLNNAAREAWGFRTGASADRMRAEIDKQRGRMGAFTTIMESASSAAAAYKFRKS